MKVLIATPSHGDWKMEFAMSYSLMIAGLVSGPPTKGFQINPRVQMGSLIPGLRHELVCEALDWGADYIFWLDDDMGFPRDTLHRLLSANKDIVAANCPRKQIPSKWTAKRGGEIVDSCGKTGLEEVDSVGCAVMLVKTDVFKKIGLPFFEIPWDHKTGGYVGEDVYFCRKAKANGISVFIDHDLSKQITHIGSYRYECFDEEMLRKASNLVE